MKRNDQKENRKRVNSQSTIQKLPPLNKKHAVADKATNLGAISHQDEGIVGLLTEYFIKNNFITTLDSFQRECSDKGFKPNSKHIEAFRQEMTEAFDKGERDTFMSRFAQYVPVSMRSRDIQTMKLQFYIQIYFFVYAIHPYLGKKRNIDKHAKQGFIAYLEGRGAPLATSAEFIHFYALANLPKPQQNATFKTIFTKEWASELKKRVAYFIEKLYPSGKSPFIIQMYDKYLQRNMEKSDELTEVDHEEIQFQIEEEIQEESQIREQPNNKGQFTLTNSRGYEQGQNNTIKQYDNTEREKESLGLKIAELEEEKNELLKFIENVKNKYQSLQNNYKDFTDAAQNTLIESQSKWFKITQEFYNIASNLLEVCERMQNGEPLADPSLVQKIGKKLNKYQSFINMNIEDLISENVDFSLFERAEHDVSTTEIAGKRNNSYMISRAHSLIQLSYDRIKETLAKPQLQFENEKCFLLEALKWRLTKTRGIMLKREVVLSMTMNDILNFKGGEETINLLLNSPNQAVLLRTMQVINALCKDYYGRDYLSSEMLIKKTIEVLKSDQTEENIKVIIISTLQQLSVRRVVQIYMIQGDMIKWVTNKLHSERETMSSYLMQYSTALLINLLLRKEGLAKSEEIKDEILTTLINLMEVEVIEIRGYVHGALYPLFSKKVFREKAKEYGLEENIKFLLENTSAESLVHQLKYLEKQLMRDDDSDEEEEDNEEDYDLDEIFDEEVGEDFELEIEIEGEGLSGEELLMKKYSLTGPDAIKQLNCTRQEVEATLKKKSVYMANSFSERPGTNNPVLGQLRRNASNNNSVYSNKSSNRILRSELNNRSQLLNKPAKDRERLDTVHPDNSDKEMSIKDFIDERSMEGQSRVLRSGASESSLRNNIRVNKPNLQNKGHAESEKVLAQEEQRVILENESFSQEEKTRARERVSEREGAPKYEKTEEYVQAFKPRREMVRTPPENER